MKIPAIRAKLGTWTYYITTLSFDQVSILVEKIDDQLHKSEGLRDLIQRSITENYLKIKEYIQNQPEMFFNSLILGVYDGMPKWIEVELNFKDEEYFNMGFLDFPGDQKIFPIDGQHRVEGIKAALKENSDLKDNRIGAIFVGHSKDDFGMKKSRRLFTTLNRYAKPVTMDDIIALDEDDSVAIVTRLMLEEFELFYGKHVTKSNNKAIPESDKSAFTSIIALYQCNKELLKQFRLKRKDENPDKKRDNKSLDDYLKFRPEEIEIDLFKEFILIFWESFKSNIRQIKEYVSLDCEQLPALNYRNRNDGGSLLFRPVGILPFVQATVELSKRSGKSYDFIFEKLDKIDFIINNLPWKYVLWNPIERTMIMGTQILVKLLIIYLYDPLLLTDSEMNSLIKKYSDKLGIEEKECLNILKQLPTVGTREIVKRKRIK